MDIRKVTLLLHIICVLTLSTKLNSRPTLNLVYTLTRVSEAIKGMNIIVRIIHYSRKEEGPGILTEILLINPQLGHWQEVWLL